MTPEVLIFITAGVSLLVALLAGPIFIPFLKKLKFGQEIREDGPKWHKSKAGTPTMGGFIFILASAAATLISLVNVKNFTSALIPLFTALCFGFVGFIDDYIKVVKKRNLGLRKLPKFLLQAACAIALVVSLEVAGVLDTSLYIPFFDVRLELGIFYHAIAVVAVVAIVNAVNFTDGLDGLASSVSIPPLVILTMLGLLLGLDGASMFSAALVAALIGFLFFNFHPAKVFMGDTGSLFLGGAIAALCLVYNMLLLILFIGIVYVIEMGSVILQVSYFKATKGKRIFKMTPIHHHFELCGWSEVKIVFVFAAVSVLFSVLGYLGFMNFLAV